MPHDHGHEHEHDHEDDELDEEREPVLALATFGSMEEATRVARALIDQQLAACVNLLPGATSIYRWEGEIQTTTEVMAVIKTSADLLEEVGGVVIELHSYEIPEFIVLPLVAGSPVYLDWLLGQLRPGLDEPLMEE